MIMFLQECCQVLQEYLGRLSELADDVMNCSAVLNWLEVSWRQISARTLEFEEKTKRRSRKKHNYRYIFAFAVN